METRFNLCPVCGRCPEVLITEDCVCIGEDQNIVRLAHAEWNQLTIGRLSRLTGVRVATLRFYEAQGLVIPLGRTAAGYRAYSEDAIEELQFVSKAKSLRMPLRAIGAILAIVPQRATNLWARARTRPRPDPAGGRATRATRRATSDSF